jgi:hypothetical protein
MLIHIKVVNLLPERSILYCMFCQSVAIDVKLIVTITKARLINFRDSLSLYF